MIKLPLPKRSIVYVLRSDHYPAFAKIGFTDRDASTRAREIEADIREKTGQRVTIEPVRQFRSLFAFQIEGLIKWLTIHQKTNKVPGEGSTEWRRNINVVCCVLMLLIIYFTGNRVSVAWAAFVLVVNYPLDLLLLAFVLSSIEYIVALALAWHFFT